MSTVNGTSRREFIRQIARSAVGYGAAFGTVLDLYRVGAAAQTIPGDYRALVCVFLFGGNDANNLLVPRSGADLTAYQAARGGLALPATSLLPITPLNPDGRDYGLHPNLPGVQALFAQQRAAMVCNLGPLVAPITRDQYRARSVPVPRQLFSHSDQQLVWQSSIPDGPPTSGWGGRIADLLHPSNASSQLSMSITLGGTNLFQVGRVVFQYPLTTSGPVGLSGYRTGTSADPESRALDRILALQHANIFERAYRDVMKNAIDTQQMVQSALAAAPPLGTAFPNTRLGQQMRMIAQMIAVRGTFGHQRQIFFCSTGGYDTHAGQLAAHVTLLGELDGALSAFHAATVELGVASGVTTFTASDFGRTLATNGSGSDHGWGSHHLIVGGAVLGGRLYGRYPVLAINGPDDVGLGRWIPTTSVDQYGATLARWFGVTGADLPLIFPNLGRFPSPDLGFLP